MMQITIKCNIRKLNDRMSIRLFNTKNVVRLGGVQQFLLILKKLGYTRGQMTTGEQDTIRVLRR